MLTFRSCLLFVLAACGPTAPVSTESAGGEASTSAPADASTSTSTTTTTTTTGSTTADPTTGGPPDETTKSFIWAPDAGPEPGCAPALARGGGGKECDPWVQDCPFGEKCTPYSGDGDDAWESLRCAELDRDPDHPGEPCTVECRVASGLDSCDIDSMCWYIDGETLTGTCVLRCHGYPDDPICPSGTACRIANDGVVNLCLPTCNPLAPDCAAGETCIPSDSSTDEFVCAPDASADPDQLFDSCYGDEVCDPGLICRPATQASECARHKQCCLPYCDLAAPPACPGVMQQCIPWFDPGEAPPGLENVGVCGLPQ